MAEAEGRYRVSALWIALAVTSLGCVVSRATAAPDARGVSASARLAAARRIAAAIEHERSIGRRPCEHPLERPRGKARRIRPRSYVAHCDHGVALRLRDTRRR